VNAYTGLVDWSSGSMNLRDALSIQGGKNTRVFDGVNNKTALPSCCLSILLVSRSLDLQANSEDERDMWLNGLRELKRRLDAPEDDYDPNSFWSMSTVGAHLIKHSKRGRPKTKIIRVDHKTGVVEWGSGSLYLQETTDIVAGKNTKVFEGVKLKTADPRCCFSIVMANRTLDLQCQTEIDRNMWLEGLKDLKEKLLHHPGEASLSEKRDSHKSGPPSPVVTHGLHASTLSTALSSHDSPPHLDLGTSTPIASTPASSGVPPPLPPPTSRPKVTGKESSSELVELIKERARAIDGLSRAVQRLNDKNLALEVEVNTLKVALDETTQTSARPRAKMALNM